MAVSEVSSASWDMSTQSSVPKQAMVQKESVIGTKVPKQSVLVLSGVPSPPLLADLPFMDAVDLGDFGTPVKPVVKPGLLREAVFALSKDKLFIDRMLPAPETS